MNPFSALIVTVEVPETPALSVRVSGLAAMPKSTNAKAGFAAWIRLPPVPVIVNPYVYAIPEVHEIVVVLLLLMLLEAIEPQLRPEGTLSVRMIIPVKP